MNLAPILKLIFGIGTLIPMGIILNKFFNWLKNQFT